MEVWTRGSTGGPYRRDDLATHHRLPRPHQKLRVVRIAGNALIRMKDLDHFSKISLLTYENYPARANVMVWPPISAD